MIISFSGNHGTGKSTHSNLTAEFLRRSGFGVKVVHIVDLSLIESVKQMFGKRMNRGEVAGMQKEYSSLFSALGRMFLYKIDLLVFFLYLLYHRIFFRRTVLIFDRYFYDKLANFDLRSLFFRAYSICYLFFVPKPDVAFYLDADAGTAYDRKKEYGFGFYEGREMAYSFLRKRVGFSVIGSDGVERTQKEIEKILSRTLFLN